MLGLTGGGVHRSFGLFVWGWGMWGGFIRALQRALNVQAGWTGLIRQPADRIPESMEREGQ